ncbi:DUF350 domain-containing protein [Tuberibacillus sp. Marseille-P3662]|uniref:DUF350 domain-containing protein n=1 Tax=Tuberibacillus sp. Marseille-P3662 TaxID=1965358 RepID=UPI0020CAC04F|nr:DUF350 domain-containing protein [Tuberibacillus sp. Marseille-P3662]
MELIWGNLYLQSLAYYSVVVLCMIVYLAVFELLTSYKNWVEIKKGNLAVALATGGKIFGIANLFRFSINHNEVLLDTIIHGTYGFVLLLLGYFIFEFLTPSFKIDNEIKEGNTAVGFISAVISIGLSFVLGASLS